MSSLDKGDPKDRQSLGRRLVGKLMHRERLKAEPFSLQEAVMTCATGTRVFYDTRTADLTVREPDDCKACYGIGETYRQRGYGDPSPCVPCKGRGWFPLIPDAASMTKKLRERAHAAHRDGDTRAWSLLIRAARAQPKGAR